MLQFKTKQKITESSITSQKFPCKKCAKKYTNINYKLCKTCQMIQIDRLKKYFTNSISENENIIVNKSSDTIFEWIPYDQFDNIEEMGKYDCATTYSAIWNVGLPKYKEKGLSTIKVVLKRLYNTQNITNEILDEVKIYAKYDFIKMYGISQNSDTKDYVMVYSSSSCGNKEIDDIIQEFNSNRNNYFVFEWIPYTQFKNIKKIGKNGFATTYSAIWKDGPLIKSKLRRAYSNKKVCLNSFQFTIYEFIYKVRNYFV
ncbi:hypothetical protein C1645_182404 [Glomus cerebriforme]|uniref:Protein kinase domain-containing protein n=1 Tax=Glomus cerebriforme TaxID=658196 RepID=A0A397SYW8_9GLOM|nr:hypothetical protein C1645_182404 [Glomus cerebriforme]